MAGQHRQGVTALPVGAQVNVVKDQHDRYGHRPERGPQPRHDRSWHGTDGRGQRLENPLADRLNPIQRRRDIAEQHFRVIVLLVSGHPGEIPLLAPGPLREQRGLPVTRRRDDRDDRPGILLGQLRDQRRPADGAGPRGRRPELRRVQVEPGHSRVPRSTVPLTKVAVLHISNRIYPDSLTFYALAPQISRQEILRRATAQTTAVFLRLPYGHRASGAPG